MGMMSPNLPVPYTLLCTSVYRVWFTIFLAQDFGIWANRQYISGYCKGFIEDEKLGSHTNDEALAQK